MFIPLKYNRKIAIYYRNILLTITILFIKHAERNEEQPGYI